MSQHDAGGEHATKVHADASAEAKTPDSHGSTRRLSTHVPSTGEKGNHDSWQGDICPRPSSAVGVPQGVDHLRSHDSVRWKMMEYGVTSEQGSRKTMEDQHKAMELEGIPFFGVYDGHGGTQCAEFLRENLHTFIFRNPHVRSEPECAIREGIAEAEKQFMSLSERDLIESGSTCAVAMVVGDSLVVGNVGDSEIVLCRDGKPLVLTTKHNLSCNDAEAERVRGVGGRVFQNRVGHPKFNPSLVSLAVSRAIGDAGFKLDEYTDGKPSGVIADAETKSVKLTEEDEFLIIGCDGLWDVMPYEVVVEFCRQRVIDGEDAQRITDSLCQEALKRGSTDNVTCMYVSLQSLKRTASSTRGWHESHESQDHTEAD